MQALKVKPVFQMQSEPKPQLFNEIHEPQLNQKSDKVKVQEADIVKLQKSKSMTRFLEAYGDCV
ncbi:MAG: hypothetical protein V4605_09620 [Pseudomonadota bacterium]